MKKKLNKEFFYVLYLSPRAVVASILKLLGTMFFVLTNRILVNRNLITAKNNCNAFTFTSQANMFCSWLIFGRDGSLRTINSIK